MMKLSLLLALTLLSVCLAAPFADIELDPSMSPELEPSPSEESDDDDVCVSETYLLSLGHTRRDLVHPNGIVSSAFCPLRSSLPCGTGSHMLRVAGESVSYEQYCETNECEKRVVLVNSVYSHLWNEREVEGVVMTMFDTRYHELPQKALHWAMHQARRVM